MFTSITKSVLFLATCLWIISPVGAADPKPVDIKVKPFDLRQVQLLDGPFKDAMERDRKYLLELDADQLLHNFRVTAGLPSKAEPLGGWEAPKCELRGHCVGHYLSACALMYRSTGDEKLKAKADYIVAELAKCQQAMPAKGFNKGFLSAYPEELFDRVDAAKPVWAPYYTLHKIMAGLLDMYELCDNRQALDVLNNMADWLKFRVGRLSHEQQQKALNNEHGGMNEIFANLYAVTGNADHLKLARDFNHESIFEPLARGEDQLNGKHANTQIPKIIGAAREYELTGEKQFADVAGNFWKYVAMDRSYCIGGHSDAEHFFPVNQFAKHLSPVTAESCNTYNMLKLTRHLFTWTPSAQLMDFYERALYNHILATQDPQTGMMMYFMSLKPGHFKVYCTPTESFWCCTGTGMENHAKYADTIYFHDADSLYLNLFIASELTWRDKGLTVRQETKFPESDTTRLTFKCEKPLTLALKFRYPSWTHDVTVTINGKPETISASPGSYVTLQREWKDGDQVVIHLPMELRTEPLPGEPAIVSILYGPIVLAGELGTEGMPKPYVHRQTDLNRTAPVEAPILLCAPKDLPIHIVPVEGKPLTFQTKDIGQPKDVTLIPYYLLHHERYTVYWNAFAPGSDEQKKYQAELDKHKEAQAKIQAMQEAMKERIVDLVEIGQAESEKAHRLDGEKSNSGEHAGLSWRDARNGWFSYEMKVKDNLPMTLMCRYWGSDSKREFDILVDGQKVATESLKSIKPNEFYQVEYPIPPELTKDKKKITVRFEAHKGSAAGGVFGCVTLKPEK